MSSTDWPAWPTLVAACAKCKPHVSPTGRIMISRISKPCVRCGTETTYRIKELSALDDDDRRRPVKEEPKEVS